MNRILNPFEALKLPDTLENSLDSGSPSTSIAFNRQGNVLAAGLADGSVALWDFDTRGESAHHAIVSAPPEALATGRRLHVSALSFRSQSQIVASYASGGWGRAAREDEEGEGLVRVVDARSRRVVTEVRFCVPIYGFVEHPRRAGVVVVLPKGRFPLLLTLMPGCFEVGDDVYEAPVAPGKAVQCWNLAKVEKTMKREEVQAQGVVAKERRKADVARKKARNESAPAAVKVRLSALESAVNRAVEEAKETLSFIALLRNADNAVTAAVLHEQTTSSHLESLVLPPPTVVKKGTKPIHPFAVAFTADGRTILRGGPDGLIHVFRFHSLEPSSSAPARPNDELLPHPGGAVDDAFAMEARRCQKFLSLCPEGSEKKKMTIECGNWVEAAKNQRSAKKTDEEKNPLIPTGVPKPLDYSKAYVTSSFQVPGGASIRSITLSKTRLLVNSNDRILRLFELDTLTNSATTSNIATPTVLAVKTTFKEAVNKSQATCACFSRDGDFVLAGMLGATSHRIVVWRTSDGHPETTLEGPSEGIVDILWHPLQSVIVSIGATYGSVHVWAKDFTENWSAFAPEFTELEANEEYSEDEGEFDAKLADNEKRRDEQRAADEDAIYVDVEKSICFSSDDEEDEVRKHREQFSLPVVPGHDNRAFTYPMLEGGKTARERLLERKRAEPEDGEVEESGSETQKRRVADTDGARSAGVLGNGSSGKLSKSREKRRDMGREEEVPPALDVMGSADVADQGNRSTEKLSPGSVDGDSMYDDDDNGLD